MAEKDAATVLEEAADLLLVKGRCVGHGVDDGGRYCVLGAIAEAAGGDASEWNYLRHPAAVAALADALRPRVTGWPDLGFFYSENRREWITREPDRVVWFWNDIIIDDETGDFEVIDTLRHVAKDLRAAAVPS